MTPECTHILPSGQKCRGLAGRNQPFCRHHRPKTLGQRPIPHRDRYTPLMRWRATGQELPYLRTEELPSLVYELLDALTQPGLAPSDRTVGRFLRAALTRLGQVPFPYPNSEPEPQNVPVPPIRPGQHAHASPASPTSAFPSSNPAELAQLQREMATLFATLAEAQQQ
ncbi:MAG TPA: hypothetical protein VHU89_16320 [Acidobacteriaceae bacterium]|jgi:hypothetical protein|nr:hypothetical protein [Acidobacteriaceae bacterium]